MRNTISHGSEKKAGDPLTCNAERDIVYRSIDAEPEQDPKLAQLDLYFTDLGGGKRVVVYVHGGRWMRGDKSEIHKNPRLLEFLLRNECLVASVNFRPIRTNEARKITYADQANDIAAALKWLSNHVEKFGGRPEAIILLGYSSGAHLSALVALDDRYLSNQGLDGSWIQGVISVDVHAYDIPAALIEMEQSPLKEYISLTTSLFGGSRSEQHAASPIAYLANAPPKSFLLFSCGLSGGRPQTVSKVMSKSFKESLIAHGHRAVHVHLGDCDHRSIFSRFGTPRDKVSKNIKDFLEIATPSRGLTTRTRSKLLASSLASNTEISEERKREAVRLLKPPTGLRWKLRANSGSPFRSSILGGSNSNGTAARAIRPRAERARSGVGLETSLLGCRTHLRKSAKSASAKPSASLKQPTGLRWKLRANSGSPCRSSILGGSNSTGTAARGRVRLTRAERRKSGLGPIPRRRQK